MVLSFSFCIFLKFPNTKILEAIQRKPIFKLVSSREHCSVWSTLPGRSSHFPPFPSCTRVVSVWLAGVWGLQLTFSFPFALQHGTEWASAPCTVCSCTHGEVRCSHQPCSPISCGPQELEFLAEGACCPICVGAGSEYQLVGRGLSVFEVADDILTLVFLFGVVWRF